MNNYNFAVQNKESKSVPIILVHGWGGSLKSLSDFQLELSKQIDNPIYNLELPGFGTTTLPDDSVWGTHDYAKYLKDFIDSQKLERVILIGHSFGGKLSIDSIVSGIIKPEKLILINASGVEPKNSAKKTVNKFLSKLIPSKLKDWQFLREVYYKKVLKERDYLTAGKLKKSLGKIVEEHYQDKLKEIEVPTLIIWGENDSYVPLWMGRLFEKELQYSKLIVVPEATHGLPLKQPKLTAEIVSGWLRNNGDEDEVLMD